MSLLEDVFLEDEAGEAQELERVIEGDEYEERPRVLSDSDDNSEKEDEAVEDKRRVEPAQGKTTRVIKNPRFILNPARLAGPRGIQVIPEHFKDFKFKGKGHEKDDLDLVLKKLEHWAYRLYPKFQFEDCLKKIETLGKKRPVMVQLHKIRSDQFQTDQPVIQNDSSDEETPAPPEEDEFDKLLQQQIELARATPAPGSVRKGFQTPGVDKRCPLTMPKATSSPSINDEQRERMMRNRQLAEERRLTKLQQNPAPTDSVPGDDITNVTTHIEAEKEVNELPLGRKHNRSNVIDSSDDEGDVPSINQAVIVDIHETIDKNVFADISEQGSRKNTTVNNDVAVVDLVCTEEINERDDIQNNAEDDNCIIDVTDQEIPEHTSLDNTATIIDLVGTDKPIARIDINTNKEHCVNEIPLVNLTDNAIAGPTQHKIDIVDLTEQYIRRKTSDDAITVVDLINTDKANKLSDTRTKNDNRSIIDSSDDECAVISVDQVENSVDIHRTMDSDSNDIEICDFTGETNKIKVLSDVTNNEKLPEGTEILSRSRNTSNIISIDNMQSNDIEEHNKKVDKIKESDRNFNKKVSIEGNDSNDIEMIIVTKESGHENLHLDKMQVDYVQESTNVETDIAYKKNIVEDVTDLDFGDDF